MLKTFLIIFALLAPALMAAIDYNALGDNTWARQALSGGVVSTAGDVHWACDTTGNAYIFGACSYGGQAGGTHNSDVYRYNLQTGAVTLLSNCANNRLGWTSGCQNGIAFDKTRNCMWVDEIAGLSVCNNNAYNGGFYKYQCPNGPLTKMAGGGGGTYLAYDNINDVVFMPDVSNLRIYNCKTNTWKTPVAYPFTQPVNTWTIPCCFDSKRGLFVITLTGPYTITTPATQVVMDVWFYNAATSQWTKKTPPTHPAIYEQELAYDEVNDKCLYFGGDCPSELWAYDYTANTWTQVAIGSRAYNDASPAASTWPPGQGKAAWAYSPKYNACVAWGGGVWISAACSEYDNGGQGIWAYRLSKTGTGVDASTVKLSAKSAFCLWPNPARNAVSFKLSGLGMGSAAQVTLYSITGQQVAGFSQNKEEATWDMSFLPAGIYQAKAVVNGREMRRSIILGK